MEDGLVVIQVIAKRRLLATDRLLHSMISYALDSVFMHYVRQLLRDVSLFGCEGQLSGDPGFQTDLSQLGAPLPGQA